MARVALIDGDSLAYRIAAACEKTKYIVTSVSESGRYGDTSQEYATHKEAAAKAALSGGQIWSRKNLGELAEASTSLERAVERCISRGQCSVFHLYLGGHSPTFRDHLARLRRYKDGRGDRPTLLSDLRAYLIKCWGGIVVAGEEVDDVLSYTSRELTDAGANVPVIVGNDKDLDQIPGEHYDWVKDEFYTVSDAEARVRLWVQVLSGDVADNIGGCWKVGEARALKVVKDVESRGWDDALMWKFVCSAYEESQGYPGCPYANLDPVEVAIENYNLVRLRQNRWEKHEYRGLFVNEKKGSDARTDVRTAETQHKTTSQDTAGSGDTTPRSEVPLEVRSEDNRGLGQEENTL